MHRTNARTCLSILLATSALVAHAQTLAIGSAAPELKVDKWVKGKPVSRFEPGKVYVVEFWATWCGPCKETIPHLTSLAKQYAGKVEFCGISVWEQPESGKDYTSTYPAVEKFVMSMGDQMGYNVAADTSSQHMANQWMKAAAQDGIPSAFIVDQKRRIAWIGHPKQLTEPLAQVVAGTYDVEAAATKWKAAQKEKADRLEKTKAAQEKAKAEFEAWQKTPLGAKFQLVTKLQKEKKYDEALAVYDEIAKFPSDSRIKDPVENASLGKLYIYQDTGNMDGFYAMAKIVYEKWNERAKKLIAEGMGLNDPENGGLSELYMLSFAMNNTFSWPIANPKSKLSRRDFDFAVMVAERTVELTQRKDPNWMDTLACAYFGRGDKEKAIAIQKEAIALCKGNPDPEYVEHLNLFMGK